MQDIDEQVGQEVEHAQQEICAKHNHSNDDERHQLSATSDGRKHDADFKSRSQVDSRLSKAGTSQEAVA